jgi:hypothetical protein
MIVDYGGVSFMERVKSGHIASMIVSIVISGLIALSMIIYYVSLISKGMYELTAEHVYNIITGFLLSSAPLLILIIANHVVLHTGNIDTVSTVFVLSLVICIPLLLIDLGKDFAFFVMAGIGMSIEMGMLAIVMTILHLLSVIPLILTEIYCYKTKKHGFLYI